MLFPQSAVFFSLLFHPSCFICLLNTNYYPIDIIYLVTYSLSPHLVIDSLVSLFLNLNRFLKDIVSLL